MANRSTAKRPARTSAVSVARANVAREARRTGWGLWIEGLIRAFWPTWAALALAAGLILLGVPAQLPQSLHYALLAAFGAAIIFLTLRGLWSLKAPSDAEKLARLDEGVRGRPAQTFDDALASGSGDIGSEALWVAHQLKLAEKAAALKAKAPDLRASTHDVFALRHGALIVLAAGVIGYFGADATRLSDLLVPATTAEAGPPPIVATLEAWASPPVYTGVSPIYLTPLSGQEISLPEGTEISLRVFDTDIAPVLEQTLGADAGDFVDQGAKVFDANITVTASGGASVTLGEAVMGNWTFAVVEDTPPTIKFDSDIVTGVRGGLTFDYFAQDDHGVRLAEAIITLDPDATPPVEGVEPDSLYGQIEFDLPLPLTGDVTTVAETVTEDLSEHPWVGLPVFITIRAQDAAGQIGEAEARMILPGRVFLHPVAKALIEQRRDLAYSSETAPRVWDVLEAVMIWPEEVFDDTAGFLAASMARRRLGYALEDGRVDAELKSIVDLLWKAAIRLEDGDLSSAAARLARAQERLEQAIENGATDDQIAQLMQELREAMADYMAELAQEALRDQANGQQQQQQGDQQMMTQQDLEEMLQQLEEALRNGQQELARQMLQALQQMMNNMQMAQPGQGQPGQGEQMMNQMGDMIGKQSDLADRSFDQMREGQSGQQQQNGGQGEGMEGEDNGQRGGRPGDDPGQIARDQEALRQLLEDLQNNLPGEAGEETRRALDGAEQAMEDAVDSLERGDARGAVDDQVRALDQLREGRNQMGRDMAEAQGRRDGQQAGRDGRGGDARDEDPLGRPRASDGATEGDATRVPGAALGKRARELQEEIRRRAGERQRPAEELDYLERLLDRF